jgi:hypothetical protein
MVKVKVTLRTTVSRPVRLGARRQSGTRDQFFFLLLFFRQLPECYFVKSSLTRGRVCNLLYNCFWALPEQNSWPYFTVSFETPPTWRAVRVRIRVSLQLTVSQSVCLGVEPNLGLLTRDIFFLTSLSCHLGGPSLTRGQVCHLSI